MPRCRAWVEQVATAYLLLSVFAFATALGCMIAKLLQITSDQIFVIFVAALYAGCLFMGMAVILRLVGDFLREGEEDEMGVKC